MMKIKIKQNMKNLIQYNSRVSIIFFNYINGAMGKEDFINCLREVEEYHMDKVGDEYLTCNKGIWFKFSKDDTLATTIINLYKDLSNENREVTLEKMQNSIKLDGELQIFYS